MPIGIFSAFMSSITYNGTCRRTNFFKKCTCIRYEYDNEVDIFLPLLLYVLAAAKLPVLLHICLLCNSSLLIYTWLLLGLHHEDQELGGNINLESNDQNSCIYCSNNLQFRLCLVCWRPHCFPHVSHQH